MVLTRIDALNADIDELETEIEAQFALSPRRSPEWMRSPESASPRRR
jgi:hypothetical protein